LPDKKKLQTGEPDADPFLIALAQSKGTTIITQEKDDPNKTKIPAVAQHYNTHIQSRSATQEEATSSGVLKPRHFLGRLLINDSI
jgi:hypothetical protein